MIGRYEAGGADSGCQPPWAHRFVSTDGTIQCERLPVRREASMESPGPDTSEQFRLAFDKEHVYTGATLRITPTRLNLTITAIAAEPQKSQRADNKVQVS